jgi:hypothetical protein
MSDAFAIGLAENGTRSIRACATGKFDSLDSWRTEHQRLEDAFLAATSKLPTATVSHDADFIPYALAVFPLLLTDEQLNAIPDGQDWADCGEAQVEAMNALGTPSAAAQITHFEHCFEEHGLIENRSRTWKIASELIQCFRQLSTARGRLPGSLPPSAKSRSKP